MQPSPFPDATHCSACFLICADVPLDLASFKHNMGCQGRVIKRSQDARLEKIPEASV